LSDDMDFEARWEAEWARIEEVSPVQLEPSKVGELIIPVVDVHPQREEIFERTRAGEKFSIRLMDPDWDAIDRGEKQPIMVQVYLDDGEFLSVLTTSILSFAADGQDLSGFVQPDAWDRRAGALARGAARPPEPAV
jgi:hypothetical protein